MRDLFSAFFGGSRGGGVGCMSPEDRRPSPVFVSPSGGPITEEKRDSLHAAGGLQQAQTQEPIRRSSFVGAIPLNPRPVSSQPPKRKPLQHVYKPEYKEKLTLYDVRSFQKRRRGIFGKELRRLIAVQELAMKARTIDYSVEDVLDVKAFEEQHTLSSDSSSSDESEDFEKAAKPAAAAAPQPAAEVTPPSQAAEAARQSLSAMAEPSPPPRRDSPLYSSTKALALGPPEVSEPSKSLRDAPPLFEAAKPAASASLSTAAEPREPIVDPPPAPPPTQTPAAPALSSIFAAPATSETLAAPEQRPPALPSLFGALPKPAEAPAATPLFPSAETSSKPTPVAEPALDLGGGSIFGNSQTPAAVSTQNAPPSLFGTGSLFGDAAATAPKPASTQQTSAIGAAAAEQPPAQSTSLFGSTFAAPAKTETNNAMGGESQGTTSLFGGINTSQPLAGGGGASQSLFGGGGASLFDTSAGGGTSSILTQTSQPLAFDAAGSGAVAPATSLFGNATSTTTQPSLFGNPAPSSNTGSSLFGNNAGSTAAASAPVPSLFQAQPATGSAFMQMATNSASGLPGQQPPGSTNSLFGNSGGGSLFSNTSPGALGTSPFGQSGGTTQPTSSIFGGDSAFPNPQQQTTGSDNCFAPPAGALRCKRRK